VDFLRRLFGGAGTSSAKEAKERLRLVLIHDRTDISPQLLENLRVEMIAVLTKYMDIDESKIEMDLDHDDRAVALVANIPVLRIKRGAALDDDSDAANGSNSSGPMEDKTSPRADSRHNLKSKRRR
jgi:cell division topological specificity factor